jgi:hypothetical protein
VADLDDRWLVDGGLALLRADAGLTVYPDAEGVVPAVPVAPYVRVYGAVSRPPGTHNALDGRSALCVVRWWCHCIGANEDAALAVAMRVRAALLDQWVHGDLVREDVADRPPMRDESLGASVYDAPRVYRLETYL